MCPFTCTSSVLSAQLHGRRAFHSRGTVTWLVQHGIAQHCSRSSERDLLFHLIIKSIFPFQIHYKLGLLWIWASEKPVLMALHRLLHPHLACLFAKLSFIFNLYFLSCCSFFSLFCIVGSGYSPLEDDEDVYARNRYKGECFAYVLRISWLLRESFVLFLFMDYKILVIQFHGFSHGFLDQDLISAFLTMEIRQSTDHHSFMHLSK